MPNPFLDPLNPQTALSEFLLEFWADMVSHDTEYASRLQRHYHEMRDKHDREKERVLTVPLSSAKRQALRGRHRKRAKRRPR